MARTSGGWDKKIGVNERKEIGENERNGIGENEWWQGREKWQERVVCDTIKLARTAE